MENDHGYPGSTRRGRKVGTEHRFKVRGSVTDNPEVVNEVVFAIGWSVTSNNSTVLQKDAARHTPVVLSS